MRRRVTIILFGLVVGMPLAGSSSAAFSTAIPGGDPQRGAALIKSVGCGACHFIPGIGDADGKVGPPLTDEGDRAIIAGVLANTPDNMITWLKDPQSVVPGNAMPNLGLNDHEARDIAAYLYTLR
jgi:cytochrome c2